MPLKNGNLTPQERVFAKRYAETGDARYAADAAGYKSSSGQMKAHDPAILAESRKHSRALLQGEGAKVGVQVLIEMALDNKQPGGTRVKAASELVKHSGIGADEGGQMKEPHEMTADELARAINMLERAAASKAKDVTPAAPASVFD